MLFDVEVHFKNRTILPLSLEARSPEDLSKTLVKPDLLHWDEKKQCNYTWSLDEVICIQIKESGKVPDIMHHQQKSLESYRSDYYNMK